MVVTESIADMMDSLLKYAENCRSAAELERHMRESTTVTQWCDKRGIHPTLMLANAPGTLCDPESIVAVEVDGQHRVDGQELGTGRRVALAVVRTAEEVAGRAAGLQVMMPRWIAFARWRACL